MSASDAQQEHIDIDWYRVPVDKALLNELNQRSDLKASLQTLGHLGLLVLTGGLAIYGVGRWPWPVIVILVFTHSTFFHFLLNAFHELCHNTVFRTRALGDLALRAISLISLHHYVLFQESHRRHHRYTLHAPFDSEVVLPIRFELWPLLRSVFISWRSPSWILGEHWAFARGVIRNPWHQILFSESKPELRRKLVSWSRLTLAAHAALLAGSVALAVAVHPRWLLLPLLTTFARCMGRWLNVLLNDTQHVGLSDNVPDFRLCARSIHVNPFLGFLYWQMQYHIEHHMYAAVPFYNLPRLNRAIRDQLPEPTRGLLATWRHIAAIQKRQKADPDYCFIPALPETAQA